MNLQKQVAKEGRKKKQQLVATGGVPFSSWQKLVVFRVFFRFRKGEFHGQGALVLLSAFNIHRCVVEKVLKNKTGDLLEVSKKLRIVFCDEVSFVVVYFYICLVHWSTGDVMTQPATVLRSTQMGAATRLRLGVPVIVLIS